MEIEFRVEGDIVERTELLNGTVTVALEGESADGAWTISGVLSWNRGLVDFAGEGDLTIFGEQGELLATLSRVVMETPSEDEGEIRLRVDYDVDSGSGLFEGWDGTLTAGVLMSEGQFEGRWILASAYTT